MQLRKSSFELSQCPFAREAPPIPPETPPPPEPEPPKNPTAAMVMAMAGASLARVLVYPEPPRPPLMPITSEVESGELHHVTPITPTECSVSSVTVVPTAAAPAFDPCHSPMVAQPALGMSLPCHQGHPSALEVSEMEEAREMAPHQLDYKATKLAQIGATPKNVFEKPRMVRTGVSGSPPLRVTVQGVEEESEESEGVLRFVLMCSTALFFNKGFSDQNFDCNNKYICEL